MVPEVKRGSAFSDEEVVRRGLRAPSALGDTVAEATWKGLESVGSEERIPGQKDQLRPNFSDRCRHLCEAHS